MNVLIGIVFRQGSKLGQWEGYRAVFPASSGGPFCTFLPGACTSLPLAPLPIRSRSGTGNIHAKYLSVTACHAYVMDTWHVHTAPANSMRRHPCSSACQGVGSSPQRAPRSPKPQPRIPSPLISPPAPSFPSASLRILVRGYSASGTSWTFSAYCAAAGSKRQPCM